jgi:uncharacterized protein (TIGR03437 family)
MTYLRLALACILFLAVFSPASAQIWDKNLIVNGDAESGTGVTTRTAAVVKNIPGWTTAGNFTLGQYVTGMTYDTRLMKTPGKQFFAGGPAGGAATATQTIDLSSGATEIDAGRVRFFLSGWLGNGGSTIGASSRVTAAFLDAAGKKLLEYAVAGPTVVETDTWGLLWRSGSGFILPNTRSVVLAVDLTSKAVAFNFAAADNLAFSVALQPILGPNLIVNGDAETTDGGPYPPGWNSADDFYTLKTSASAIKEPAADTLGVFLFGEKGGTSPRSADAYQTIDVTLARDRIDGGKVAFSFSALLGGFVDAADDASDVKTEFLDASGKALGATAQLGPVALQDHAGKSALIPRSAKGYLPVGTRLIRVTMSFVAKKAPIWGVRAYVDNVVLTLSSGGTVAIKEGGIVHAATLGTGPVAPGQMILVYATGVNLASTARMQLDSAGKMSTFIGAARLFFDGTQAPLISVNSGQVAGIVPFDVEGKSEVLVRVEYEGVQSEAVRVPVAATSPGIFTQDGTPSGVGLIFNSDYSLNSKDNPAAEGSAVTLYWSGGGQTDPPGVDGRIEVMPLSRPRAPVSIAIGGKLAPLLYAGAVPFGWAGLLFAEITVPAELSSGDPVSVPVVVTAGSASSPDTPVLIWVRKP